MQISGTLLPHPSGTHGVLIGSAVLVVAAGVATWFYVRPSTTSPRRCFTRFTLACFGAVAAWLVLVPILFRIFDLPGSAGPVQYACGDPTALRVFSVRGWTFVLAFCSIALSPLLALAVGRMWRDAGSRPMVVAWLWALGVLTRMIDLRFAPTV